MHLNQFLKVIKMFIMIYSDIVSLDRVDFSFVSLEFYKIQSFSLKTEKMHAYLQNVTK